MPETPLTDVAALTYEQARDELIQVVARLEAGGEALEASLALWERGEALAARCQEWLDGARERLDAATRAGQGTHTGDDTEGEA
ncbi:exodeoxyribonuclease VII small subunit [Sanguibacter sp. A247]|uniref:exodeoxyribonuclease VII small subunit n=1 Tax=unclassified Sanguibacter TaxID=2645534 RepID=UPI003FD7E28D